MARKTYGWDEQDQPTIVEWPIPGSSVVHDISMPANATVPALAKTIGELVTNYNILVKMLRAYDILEPPS